MEFEWKEKYDTMKQNYKELQILRRVSVREDIVELEAKINEHTKIHNLAISELEKQKNIMENKIKRVKDIKQNLSSCRATIKRIQNEIAPKDKILAQLFKYENLHLLEYGGDYYRIGKGLDNQYVFIITNKSGIIKYEPVTVPSDINDNDHDIRRWCFRRITIEPKDFNQLLSSISNSVYNE
jgi:hypothetical protein